MRALVNGPVVVGVLCRVSRRGPGCYLNPGDGVYDALPSDTDVCGRAAGRAGHRRAAVVGPVTGLFRLDTEMSGGYWPGEPSNAYTFFGPLNTSRRADPVCPFILVVAVMHKTPRSGTSARRSCVRLMALLAPLAGRAYRLLWIGQSISSAGDALVQVALVFAILHVGGTASDIGYVAAIQAVTRIAFVLAGGVWADRLRRQFVMLASDALRAAVQAALAVLLFAGQAHVWELGLGAALYGAAQSFFGPASTGLVPKTVATGQLQQANALMGFSASFFNVGGPAAAGLLIAVFGPALVFAIDAATFVVSAISLGLLRLPSRSLPQRCSLRADLAVGWHELALRPWYWLNLIAHALWNFAIPAYFVLGPVIAATMLGGPSAWGAICASWAVGAVAGGIISLRFRPRRPLVVGNLALTLGALPLLALAPPLATWEIGIAAALGGGAMVFMNSVWTTTMQELFPDQVRSRVDSYDWLISLVVMPVGFAIIGPLAARAGDMVTLVGDALILAVPCILVVLHPGIRAVRRNTEGEIVHSPMKNPAPLTVAEVSSD